LRTVGNFMEKQPCAGLMPAFERSRLGADDGYTQNQDKVRGDMAAEFKEAVAPKKRGKYGRCAALESLRASHFPPPDDGDLPTSEAKFPAAHTVFAQRFQSRQRDTM
jgi:hypothetical protein